MSIASLNLFFFARNDLIIEVVSCTPTSPPLFLYLYFFLHLVFQRNCLLFHYLFLFLSRSHFLFLFHDYYSLILPLLEGKCQLCWRWGACELLNYHIFDFILLFICFLTCLNLFLFTIYF